MYNEIFQALVVEDVLLSKQFLDVGFGGVIRLGPLRLSRVWQTEKHL
jgi:hypothetical protein